MCAFFLAVDIQHTYHFRVIGICSVTTDWIFDNINNTPSMSVLNLHPREMQALRSQNYDRDTTSY